MTIYGLQSDKLLILSFEPCGGDAGLQWEINVPLGAVLRRNDAGHAANAHGECNREQAQKLFHRCAPVGGAVERSPARGDPGVGAIFFKEYRTDSGTGNFPESIRTWRPSRGNLARHNMKLLML